jgi:hypothetical protein
MPWSALELQERSSRRCRPLLHSSSRANRRSRLNHPSVRSTIQRLAWTTNPGLGSVRFTISTSMPACWAMRSTRGPS